VLEQGATKLRTETVENGRLSVVERQALAHWQERWEAVRALRQDAMVLSGDEWTVRPRERS
jgi:hypothetical protein